MTSLPPVSVSFFLSLSLSLSVLPTTPHAQYRKRFRSSYKYILDLSVVALHMALAISSSQSCGLVAFLLSPFALVLSCCNSKLSLSLFCHFHFFLFSSIGFKPSSTCCLYDLSNTLFVCSGRPRKVAEGVWLAVLTTFCVILG